MGEAYFPPDAIEKITIKTITAIKRVPFSSNVLLIESGGRRSMHYLRYAIISLHADPARKILARNSYQFSCAKKKAPENRSGAL
ncbi:MAG: hypothetical protein LBP69_09155, partial [Treponema sp.]|nr:hypothetical protein [Treponema sp.]